MSDKHWSEVAADGVMQHVSFRGEINWQQAADAIRTALAGAGKVVVDREEIVRRCISKRFRVQGSHLYCDWCHHETPVGLEFKWDDAEHEQFCPLAPPAQKER